MARERIAVLMDPEEGGAGHTYYNRTAPPSTLDINILIVTTSLFAVLILALCMHFTIRWALSRFFHVTRLQLADSSPHLIPTSSSGLLKVQVDSLPTQLYTKKAELAVHVGAPAPSQCPICLADFADGESIRVLPNCQHGFHVACIDTWLATHTSCPICRGNLMNALPAEVPSRVLLHNVHILVSTVPPPVA